MTAASDRHPKQRKDHGARGPCSISAPAFSPASRAIPEALAIVDGDVRLNYREWYRRISALVAGFDELGLGAGDHLVTVLQNRWQAATLHWACQFAGIIITPLNWRITADELDFCLDDAQAMALVYEEASAQSVRAVARRRESSRASRVGLPQALDLAFETLIERHGR